MTAKTFQIVGQVVENSTGKGMPNYRVEAWDKDAKYHDLLGVAISGSEGGFRMEFDTTYFRVDDREEVPDLFFKVFLGRKLALNTEDSLIQDPSEKEKVILRVGAPAPRPEGKDRLSTAQAFKASEFFRDSDFRGTFSAFQGKAGASFGVVSDMVKNSLAKFDWAPVRAPDSDDKEIVGNDLTHVRANLASRNIEVAEERPYNPLLNAESLKSIAVFPTNLKAGQRVHLYHENGKVRYYSLVKETTTTSSGNPEDLERQRAEIETMKADLRQTRELVTVKDEQIAKLEEELKGIRKDQDDVNRILKSDAFGKLMKANTRGLPKK